MRTRSLMISATLIAALVLALAVIAVAADPFIGTWKMNTAKAQVIGPGTPDKSSIAKLEAIENGIKFTSDVVNAENKASHMEFTVKFDGKYYPVKDSSVDSVMVNRRNSRTLEYSFKKDGKVVTTYLAIASEDGKKTSVVMKTKSPKGEDITIITAGDKQ
jgi:hypothetical protein